MSVPLAANVYHIALCFVDIISHINVGGRRKKNVNVYSTPLVYLNCLTMNIRKKMHVNE